MATEAQRLIGISLTKIAQSRAHRGGVSLHKNLLVATVLQKARYIFMEEAYHMVQSGTYCSVPAIHTPPQQQQQQQPQHEYEQSYDEDNLVALTPEEAGIGPDSESALQEFLEPSCVRCGDIQNGGRGKENVPPQHTTELTYLDLDKTTGGGGVLRERSQACLKRRRAVTEWETEEAVLSILPKRSRTSGEPDQEDGDDSVFLDEAAALFSDCVAREVAADRTQEDSSSSSSAMEIDRITSLVSIFSFGNLAVSTGDSGKLSRSVSTPDLCSAQAKEAGDVLQQRPYLAMTV